MLFDNCEINVTFEEAVFNNTVATFCKYNALPADSMNISINVWREIEIDDIGDMMKVDATGDS